MDVALVYEGSTNTDRLNFIMTSPSQKPRNHSASTPEARGWEHQPPVSNVHQAESPGVIIPSSTPPLDHISCRARAPVRFHRWFYLTSI
ncbi:hypothetical protein ASPBRDRAFT_36533 [Aspergillus brasiliensis CBS 101740]|uniref:Uncharacterized protein n=1 Tax=Aspergillus brasiliensis (strain CBS 101740 / IMI 381727 / IBT 21946) TaxID=767769 RepID=A0A1L9V034_ASPBC|nr:hypothetical protein ASPBRDRAFT_36533 [Aspergillus brasiliensis CBS 101740]